MNSVSSNYEVITFYVICMLIWLVVTGRVESIIRSIGGNVDTGANEPTSGNENTPPSFGPPVSSGPPVRRR